MSSIQQKRISLQNSISNVAAGGGTQRFIGGLRGSSEQESFGVVMLGSVFGASQDLWRSKVRGEIAGKPELFLHAFRLRNFFS